MKKWLLILLVFVSCSKDEIPTPIVTPPVVVTPPTAPTSSEWLDNNNIEKEVVDPQLKSNGKGQLTVPVIIINYLPKTKGDSLDMNLASDGYWELKHSTIEQCKSKIKIDKIVDKLSIDEGSRFRDYGRDVVNQYISIDVVEYINVYKLDYIMINGTRMIDYTKLFDKINIRKYVDSLPPEKRVKEIWFTIFAKGDENMPSLKKEETKKYINPLTVYAQPESNMSSPITGDVSNSSKITTDLPIYDNTYVVYGFEGTRGSDTDLHNRGHQIEAQMTHIDNSEKIMFGGNRLVPMFFWKEFVGWDPIVDRPLGRSGCTHMPPNTTEDYNYSSKTMVKSDIMTWKPGGGIPEYVNTDTWTNIKYKYSLGPYLNDSHLKWMIFWFQSIPGKDNGIPYGTKKLTNWWDIFYKWDETMVNKKTLYN
jgi:hypothetical protein